MASPREISRPAVGDAVSHSLSPSVQSPTASQGSFLAGSFAHRASAAAKQLKPFNTGDIKILLLENVNQTGRDILTGQGYQVEFLKTSLPEDELIEKIR